MVFCLALAVWTALGIALSSLSPAAAEQGAVVLGDVERSEQQVTFTLRVPVTAGEAAPAIAVRLAGATLPSTSKAGAAAGQVRTAVLVLDASGSMKGSGIAAAKKAAQAFAATVAPDVRVGLVAFNVRPTLLTPPTTDRGALAAGLGRLAVGGDTSLYDGVVLAARVAGPGGRLVVLSDGADTISTAGLSQVLSALRSSGTHADVVAFQTPDAEGAPLAQIASAGGGRVVNATGATELASAFAAAAKAVPVTVVATATLPADHYTGANLDVMVTTKAGRESVEVPVPALENVAGLARPHRTAAAAGQPAVVTVASSSWLLNLWIIVPVAAGMLAVIVVLLWPRPQTPEQRRRKALKAYTVQGVGDPVFAAPSKHGAPGGGGPAAAAGGAAPPAVSSAAAGVVQVSERLIAARGQESAIAMRLDRAAISLRPPEWITLRACLAAVVALLLAVASGHHIIGLLLGATIGWLATGVFLRVRQARRIRAFADQMPDTLQLVASSLRSGFSLPQALAAAHEHGVEPMASELGRALIATRIGAVLEDELEQIAVRMKNEDWRWAVMAIRIQRSVGGNLAEVFQTTARTLRERAGLTRQVRALSAEGRLSAYILIALPFLVALPLIAFRRTYLTPLWTTVPGAIMLLIGALGMVIGWVWMSKIVKVEV